MKWFNRIIKTEKRYHPCPCCGGLTLHSKGNYEGCFLCGWEDDGQDDWDADEVRGGPNEDHSLTEARANFKRFLTMHNPEKEDGQGWLTEPAKRIKLEIINTFEKIKYESDPRKLEALWDNIRKNNDLLYGSDLERTLNNKENRKR
jgi:hypothetical protein